MHNPFRPTLSGETATCNRFQSRSRLIGACTITEQIRCGYLCFFRATTNHIPNRLDLFAEK
jgi:hypothetical protein